MSTRGKLGFAGVVALSLGCAGLTGCAELSEDRTEALGERIDRQDARIGDRMTRREMRAEAEERRYDAWYDRIMGRSGSGY
jgi:hypothetical protein